MAWTRIRGHDEARQQLFAAFRRGRLAHAYLFVGPDGVGKKAFAVEFAKALLCERPPAELTACDRCPADAFAAPGPLVAITIPGRPVSLPHASAAIAAPPSCRNTVTATGES